MTTTTESAPDIEIYIHKIKLEHVLEWVTSRLHDVKSIRQQKKQHHLIGTWENEPISILVFDRVVDGYTSVWFDSPKSPWKNDIECARDAFESIGHEVRCIVGSWENSQDPDLWWSISGDTEGNVIWNTG